MFAAVLLLFFVPWLDRSPVKSIRYRGPIYKVALMVFAVSFIVLGYCGMKPPSSRSRRSRSSARSSTSPSSC